MASTRSRTRSSKLPEVEQLRRAAPVVEDANFSPNVSDAVEMETSKTSASPSDKEEDTSFEDPFECNFTNFDKFKHVINKRCSKTYTYAKKPVVVASKFDDLLNNLSRQDERSSHIYEPEEVLPSDESDAEPEPELPEPIMPALPKQKQQKASSPGPSTSKGLKQTKVIKRTKPLVESNRNTSDPEEIVSTPVTPVTHTPKKTRKRKQAVAVSVKAAKAKSPRVKMPRKAKKN